MVHGQLILLKSHLEKIVHLSWYHSHLEISEILQMTQVLFKLTLWLFYEQFVHFNPTRLILLQVLSLSMIWR